MSLPTQAQLDTRQQDATKRLSKLRSAYEDFLTSWKEIEHDTVVLQKNLSGKIDTAKMHDILKHIDTLNESL
ncbi:MAG: hypothetical protein CO029_03090 [Candidatus Magasanikbacteria bacterium CG_4_9_14_0_2_um_filter_41_10]|uniref:Uncharacterized protein n=1 Tax=Candidatus Magasanikbacteria bacterium CG_4_10_14_0_2_um_filter_41_31 TaxID=1974639 RepID=A0A2M7V267_9BACT|nr:MAG: hypothetical protein AUJ37_01110 [Candidatus Magasanikbacteria bacterium CG1_02_41_34]PIZ92513.1 MAG: hypothetical protein COX83_04195 [Candidatus Magasanikbacteria bacterium CG_4_10_14_0_2_um_filter_41_31]PJC53394.1 MAG: hypothetical protein CO029_03090 [Candidatus Magasanikbacteria bacterium CG_4_9_14_0_2_um_filter_41_10]